MELKLYNTLTREKEVFRPLDPARVRMYVCGPTVYDHAHIGNARPVIVFDVLFRLLRHLYGAEHVTYARNVTDVDDKINARAAERKIPIRELTEETYRDFKADVAALGCLEPTIEPRATEYVPQMIKMIEGLIATRHAYPAEGHVLFDVKSKPDYGKLSNRSVDEMIAGARVEVAPYKKNPMDFVLWKPSTPELPGWDSPWGRGRPGWHIECSAMGEALLGETFDIHGGGIDLAFPHHENEIAQSECVHGGAPLAQVWMHNGFLQVEGEKMAKSVGNFVTIRELLDGWRGYAWPGEALRFNMLRTHYRQPIDWTFENLDESHKTLWDWYGDLRNTQDGADVPSEFIESLCDDLNTPAAITALHVLRKNGNLPALHSALQFLGFRLRSEKSSQQVPNSNQQVPFVQSNSSDTAAIQIIHEIRRRQMAAVQSTTGSALPPLPMRATSLPTDEEIKKLISDRDQARKAKNFKEADRIRDELAKMGVVLKDSPEGTTWEPTR